MLSLLADTKCPRPGCSFTIAEEDLSEAVYQYMLGVRDRTNRRPVFHEELEGESSTDNRFEKSSIRGDGNVMGRMATPFPPSVDDSSFREQITILTNR
jgi:hypothetical protein